MADQDNLNTEVMWQAVLDRDVTFNGRFVYGVLTTGIYCRPGCTSRQPNRSNVRFYLSAEQARADGLRHCLRCRPDEAEAPQIQFALQVAEYIHDHVLQPMTLTVLGTEFHVSPFHLQRVFKRIMGVTPKQYATSIRMEIFKTGVKQGSGVTKAQNDAGFGSSSRLYEYSRVQLGMSPATYRKGGEGVVIRYVIVDCRLGRMLIATTDKGLCMVSFGDSDLDLETALAREYPKAVHQNDTQTLKPMIDMLLSYIDGDRKALDMALDVPGTSFQWQVWRALQAIPYGVTRSYQEIAEAIGNPKAARAVGHACATNCVALVIPCHRAIRVGGGMGGYRWGLQRKEKLLDHERG